MKILGLIIKELIIGHVNSYIFYYKCFLGEDSHLEPAAHFYAACLKLSYRIFYKYNYDDVFFTAFRVKLISGNDWILKQYVKYCLSFYGSHILR